MTMTDTIAALVRRQHAIEQRGNTELRLVADALVAEKDRAAHRHAVFTAEMGTEAAGMDPEQVAEMYREHKATHPELYETEVAARGDD